MKISLNWLKQYVDLPDSVSAADIARRLNLSTVEVEGLFEPGENLKEVVVGKVISVEKHPQADRLNKCLVSVGNENLPVVCGGSNVRAQMLVALAKVGAKVRWHGAGDLVELKPTVIRGEESRGMICASTEIGLGEMFPLKDEKEILDLTFTGAAPGVFLAEALKLNDTIFEIDNKSLSNRPDLWGHYGLAREVAALFGKKVKDYPAKKIAGGKGLKLKVEVKDKTACPRYLAAAVSGVKAGPSPEWLKSKLAAAGLRSINNIVDITNYVMLDLGQPMHAFDSSKLKGQNSKLIVVRRAKKGEELVTLDDQKLKLSEDDLVIADEEKPLALAGVMGGAESGVTDATQVIIFESANFAPEAARRASLRHGLRTESSMRFEKGLDPWQCQKALEKAVELTLQLVPGARPASVVAEAAAFNKTAPVLEMPSDYLAKILGAAPPNKEVVKILTGLGFEVKEKKNILTVGVPSWRATKDISSPEDIAEEVLRVWGYDKIKGEMPRLVLEAPETNRPRALEHRLRDILTGELGYSEVYNYSFVSAGQIKALGQGPEKYLELHNPVSEAKPYLRRKLMHNLLENVLTNIENYPEVKIFEIGKVFAGELPGVRAFGGSDELLPRQDTIFTAVYINKKDAAPFWAVRRAVETIFSALRAPWEVAAPAGEHAPLPFEHPGRTSLIKCHGQVVGIFGELHPLTAAKLGLPARLASVSLNLNNLEAVLSEHGAEFSYQPLPAFPQVSRDLAVVVKKSVASGQIIKALLGLDQLLKSVELFDAYEGQGIGKGCKSLAYRLTYAHSARTLTSEEVDKIQNKAVKVLAEKFGAEVRK